MNEDQASQVDEIVQEIAHDDGITFDAAFIVAVGVLKLHTLNLPKGRASGGSKAQSTGNQADQVSD
ncbi:hypothetical protein PS870_01690 [Pseudomonas fluorescens]|uniref:Uncharacterized protein n=1 Tax=Pseudomonas fluorescens TaxID=294 RepID=A0A5E7IS73_PSEFL|nr:hypothetical protein [Pseudomonas fluorescens]VVO79010.1 hypothetical protein PS870_01690 [Pseudomonas fluorescens]